jgi:uncharacterized glyoxalase superfamily protein PhnB
MTAVPEGFHTVTPYLAIHGVGKVVQFVKEAFGAEEFCMHQMPSGLHAEMRIGDSIVMIGEKPAADPPFPAMLYLYVADADEVYRRALAAGGKSIREPADQPYGDRAGGVEDSAGNQWWMATRLPNRSQ